MRNSILLIFALCMGYTTVAQTEEELHLEAKKKWLHALYVLCEKTNDSEAFAVYEMLTRSVAVMPDGQKLKRLETNDNPYPVLFIPVMTTDTSNKYLLGFFLHDQPNIRSCFYWDMLCVRDYQPCSEFTRGALLLHEGSHAMRKYRTFDFEDYNRGEEEIKAYELEFRVEEKYLGEAYVAELQNEVKRFCGLLAETGMTKLGREFHSSIIQKKLSYPELIPIFSCPMDVEELGMREYAFWINAVFRFIKENAEPEDVRGFQIDFILEMQKGLEN